MLRGNEFWRKEEVYFGKVEKQDAQSCHECWNGEVTLARREVLSLEPTKRPRVRFQIHHGRAAPDREGLRKGLTRVLRGEYCSHQPTAV